MKTKLEQLAAKWREEARAHRGYCPVSAKVKENHAAELEAALSTQAADQWQPIGSEPLDKPLLFTDGQTVAAYQVVVYSTLRHLQTHGDSGYDSDPDIRYESATHWMPLPTLPPAPTQKSHE